MDTKQAADLYLEDAVETAPPAKLVRMLLEGAVRFLDRSAASSPQSDRRAFVHGLHRANDIVTELRLSLVPAPGSDVAANLDRLYLFCEERLGTAILESRIEPANEARAVLAILLDAWQGIELHGESV